MNATIKVSIPEFRSKLAAFKDHRQRLVNFITKLEQAIKAISQVAWVSPASKALLVKYQQLLTTVRTALRIVEKYISDLEDATKLFTEADARVMDNINALTDGSDIFKV